jgi:hypothetical protein
VKDIAEAIGPKTADQAYTLIKNKRVEGVIHCVGHRLAASWRQLLEHFTRSDVDLIQT